MNKQQKQVQEFMKKANQLIPVVPKIPRNELFQLRQQLITEEYSEFIEAHFNKDIIQIIDALCDMMYTIYGYANTLGLDLEPYFNEVHRSNMEKITESGVKLNEQGKIMKPSGWKPPTIQEIFLEACNNAAKGKTYVSENQGVS